MTVTEAECKISVIIPTRDRVQLLERAINSIREQTLTHWEIVLVDTGKTNSTKIWYQQLTAVEQSKIRYFALRAPEGTSAFGPSAARNYGVYQSKSEIIAFLDDDDEWIDNTHLNTAFTYLNNCLDSEVYLSQQEAIRNNDLETPIRNNSIWIENINFGEISINTLSDDTFLVDSYKLLQKGQFCHLNCTIVMKGLFNQLAGFDETIHYEEDKEFYFRLLNKSQATLVTTKVVSRHFIPTKNTASTSIDLNKKLFYQLTLYQKSLFNGVEPRQRMLNETSDIMKRVTEARLSENDIDSAAYYAVKALVCRFSLKWFARCTLILFKKAFKI